MESDDTVSVMETQESIGNGQGRPSREQADAALHEADRIRSGIQNQPIQVPWWYFPVMGVCLVGITLAQLLPTFWTIGVTVVLAAAVGAAAGVGLRAGRYMPKVTFAQTLPFVVPVVLMVILAIVLHRSFGLRWVWYVVAALCVVFVFCVAMYHRRTLERSAQ